VHWGVKYKPIEALSVNLKNPLQPWKWLCSIKVDAHPLTAWKDKQPTKMECKTNHQEEAYKGDIKGSAFWICKECGYEWEYEPEVW